MGYWSFEATKRTSLAYSQRELNELYLGPNFFLSYRSAQLLMTLFVTMLYSAGLPALYPIACAMFATQYYVDKFLFFNYYRTPPSYSEKLSEWFVGSMSYAVIGHLAFATWMYSAKGIFWDGVTASDVSTAAVYFGLNGNIDDGSFDFTNRLSQTHVLPLYITLLVILLLKVFSSCFNWIDRIRQILCVTVTCGIFDDGTIKRRYLNPDYTEAVEGGELRGLVTYNMLENPTYARALGIDARFAREHRHIASVHEASAVELPTLPKSFKIAPLEVTSSKRESKKRDKDRGDSLDSGRSKDNDDDSASTGGARPLSINRRSVVDQVNAQGGDMEGGTRSRGNSTASARLANAFRVEEEAPRRPSGGATPSKPRTDSTASAGPDRRSLARAFNVTRDDFT